MAIGVHVLVPGRLVLLEPVGCDDPPSDDLLPRAIFDLQLVVASNRLQDPLGHGFPGPLLSSKDGVPKDDPQVQVCWLDELRERLFEERN